MITTQPTQGEQRLSTTNTAPRVDTADLEAALAVECDPVNVVLTGGERARLIAAINHFDGDKVSRLEKQHDVYLSVRFRHCSTRHQSLADRERLAKERLRDARADAVDPLADIQAIAAAVARKLEVRDIVGADAETRAKYDARNPIPHTAQQQRIDSAADVIVSAIHQHR